jgi:hypothetical protein
MVAAAAPFFGVSMVTVDSTSNESKFAAPRFSFKSQFGRRQVDVIGIAPSVSILKTAYFVVAPPFSLAHSRLLRSRCGHTASALNVAN